MNEVQYLSVSDSLCRGGFSETSLSDGRMCAFACTDTVLFGTLWASQDKRMPRLSPVVARSHRDENFACVLVSACNHMDLDLFVGVRQLSVSKSGKRDAVGSAGRLIVQHVSADTLHKSCGRVRSGAPACPSQEIAVFELPSSPLMIYRTSNAGACAPDPIWVVCSDGALLALVRTAKCNPREWCIISAFALFPDLRWLPEFPLSLACSSSADRLVLAVGGDIGTWLVLEATSSDIALKLASIAAAPAVPAPDITPAAVDSGDMPPPAQTLPAPATRPHPIGHGAGDGSPDSDDEPYASPMRTDDVNYESRLHSVGVGVGVEPIPVTPAAVLLPAPITALSVIQLPASPPQTANRQLLVVGTASGAVYALAFEHGQLRTGMQQLAALLDGRSLSQPASACVVSPPLLGEIISGLSCRLEPSLSLFSEHKVHIVASLGHSLRAFRCGIDASGSLTSRPLWGGLTAKPCIGVSLLADPYYASKSNTQGSNFGGGEEIVSTSNRLSTLLSFTVYGVSLWRWDVGVVAQHRVQQ